MDIEYSSQIQVQFQEEKVQNQSENRTKTSKYEEVYGKTEENYRLAKLRFKNSALMPPPPKIEERNKDLLQNAKDKYKRKLNKIFTNLSRKDIQAKANFLAKNQFNKKKDYLDESELQIFVSQIKFTIESRFKSFMRTTEDYFKDNLYEQMKKCINTIKKWVKMIEQRVQTMYKQRIQSLNLMRDLLQKYNWYSQFVPMSYQNQTSNQTESEKFQRQLMLSNVMRLQKQIADIKEKESAPKLLEYILNQRNFRNNFVLDSDSGSNTDNND